MSLPLTPESYEACLHDTFNLPLADGTATSFTLTQVKRHHDNDLQLSFSLLFFGKTPGMFPQQTYPLRHPRLGELDFFLVPIQEKADGVFYEAVFNLLKDEPQ
jgi:hypothetical protein